MFSLTIYLHSNGHKKKSDTLYKNTEVQLLEEKKRDRGRVGEKEEGNAERLDVCALRVARASVHEYIYIREYRRVYYTAVPSAHAASLVQSWYLLVMSRVGF